MEYKGRYIIVGPPGTGKTRRIAQSVERITRLYGGAGACLICSLTRAAAIEAAGRCPGLRRESVGTLHAHAYRALGCPIIAETKVQEFVENHKQYQLTGGRSKAEDDPLDTPGETEADKTLAEYQRLRAIKRDPHKDERKTIVSFATTWDNWKRESNYLDFTDIIEIATKDVEQAPTNPSIIFADEAQDHSALELDLLQKWGDKAGALILVGDPWQSLYNWRGAHPEMFDDPTVDQSHRDVLGQSYRIPRAVHRAAITWIKGLSTYKPIEYKPREGDEGTVEHCGATYKAPHAALISQHQVQKKNRESYLYVFSCLYMTLPIVACLRDAGIPFANPWRTKNGVWNPIRAVEGTVSAADRVISWLAPVTGRGLAQREAVTPDDDDSFAFGHNAGEGVRDHAGWTYEELAAFLDPMESAGCLQRGAKAQIKRLAAETPGAVVTEGVLREIASDDALGPMACVSRGGGTVAEALTWWLPRVLTSKRGPLEYAANIARRDPAQLFEAPRVYVGTIHSVKGAEADHVYLFPDLSPAGFGEWMDKDKRDNVIRMFYVGITRARKSLHICDPVGGMCADKLVECLRKS